MIDSNLFIVNVLTVTYGHRWDFLNKLLFQLESEYRISKIFIIDNGSDYVLPLRVKECNYHKCQIKSFQSNRGTAVAFKAGISWFLDEGDSQYLWIIDDDNLPESNALSELVNKIESFSIIEEQSVFALLSLRNDKEYLKLVAQGAPARWLFPRKNAFFGFNILDFFQYVFFNLQKRAFKKRSTRSGAMKIPFAPYGGLLLSKNTIRKIGLPDERFFVYADDSEYTFRITKSGGDIFMITSSRINDQNPSWTDVTKHRLFMPRYLSRKLDPVFTYYWVRNTTYFLKENMISSSFLFKFNTLVYLIYHFLLAIMLFRMRQYLLFFQGVQDGLNNRFRNFAELPSYLRG
jgi:GT2 family glycosyltransferase